MRLILDFGNTLKKIAVFDKQELVELFVLADLSLDDLKKIANNYPSIQSAIISSVVNYPNDIDEYLSSNYYYIKLSHSTPIPFNNKYESKQTLGNDRLAAVAYASWHYHGKHVLVVDAGSCITFDFLNQNNEYLGGAISPGLNLRFKALNNFTDKLPLVESDNIDYLIGKTTKESILSGVINGVCMEIDGIIDSYKDHYENLTIIMSGGDYKYFDKRLKNNIFALPNIVLLGLNVILDFNESK